MTTYILARLRPGEPTANVVNCLLKHGASFHSSTVVRELSRFIDDYETEETESRLAEEKRELSGDSPNSFLKLPQSIPRKPDHDSPLHDDNGEENASEVIADFRDENPERKLTEERETFEKVFKLPAKRAPFPSMENLNGNGQRALNAVDLLDEDILLAEETRDSPNFLHNVLQPITRNPDEDSVVQKTAEAKKAPEVIPGRQDEHLKRKLTEQSAFFEKPFKLPVKLVPFPSMTKKSGNGPKALNAVDLLNENPDSLPLLVSPLPQVSTDYTIPGNVPVFIVNEGMPVVKQEEPSELDNIGTQGFINPFVSHSDLAYYNQHLDDKTNIKMEVSEECDVAPADSVENRRAKESNEDPFAYRRRVVRQSYVCPFCFKNMVSADGFDIHIRTHTGEKPYKCDLCERTFNSSWSCKRHRDTHTKEKEHMCKECGMTLSSACGLKRHCLTMHTKEAQFECQVCGRVFGRSDHLRRHYRNFHKTGLQCDVCSLSFSRPGDLKTHMKAHLFRVGEQKKEEEEEKEQENKAAGEEE